MALVYIQFNDKDNIRDKVLRPKTILMTTIHKLKFPSEHFLSNRINLLEFVAALTSFDGHFAKLSA